MRYLSSIATGLIVLFMVLAATSAAHKSATVDEFAHLATGLYAWHTRDFSLYAKTPPTARMLGTMPALVFTPKVPTDLARLHQGAWLPWSYATWFQLENKEKYDGILRASRNATIIAGALLILAIFFASRARYGDAGALISVAAAALSPTLIAHSSLVTTDIAGALFFFASCLLMLRFIKAPRALHLVLMTMTAALAVLSKFSLLIVVPLLALAPAAAVLWRRRLERRQEETGPPVPVGLALASLAVSAAVFWFTLVMGYAAKDVGQYQEPIHSRSLLAVEPLLRIPPLPRQFVRGLDLQLTDAERGEWRSGNYLLGKWYGGGRWYYYFVALAAKEPLPCLLAVLVALGFILRKPRFDEAVLIGIAAAYFMVASLFGALQIGIRYLLPIYPIGFLLLGRLGEYVSKQSPAPMKRRQAVAAGLAIAGLWAGIDNLKTWPDYLSYFSPVVGGADRGRRVLLDSNLDWGQDLPGLAAWMADKQISKIDLAYFGHDNPRRFGIDFSLPGRGSGNRYLAVSANYLMGRDYPMTFVGQPPGKSDPMWIMVASYRDKKPIAVIGHSIYLFDQGGP